MKILFVLHVEFEQPAAVLKWADQKQHSSRIILARDLHDVNAQNYDTLVLMGGPMGVHDQEKYPFLSGEFEFVSQWIIAGKKAVGICLGAQVLAHVLGATVRKNGEKEIGWFPLDIFWPEKCEGFATFHWHGETFDLPDGAIRIASNDTCQNQGFLWKKQLLGLQYHMEVNNDTVLGLLENCADELEEKGTFIQDREQILQGIVQHQRKNEEQLFKILDHFFSDGFS